MGKKRPFVRDEDEEEVTIEEMRRHRIKLSDGGRELAEFDIKVVLSPEVHKKLLSYVKGTNKEISGLGRVRNNGGVLEVTDVWLMKQKVTTATTELDEDDMAKFFTEAVRNGVDTTDVRLWWHSHANMSIDNDSWSGTDDKTIRELGRDSFVLSLLWNRSGNVIARVDIGKPCKVTLLGVPVYLEAEVEEELIKACHQEIKEKVEEDKWWVTPYRGKGSHGYYDSELGRFVWNNEIELVKKRSKEVRELEEKGLTPTEIERKLKYCPYCLADYSRCTCIEGGML